MPRISPYVRVSQRLAVVAVLAVALTGVVSVTDASAAVGRISGPDRVSTAVSVATEGWDQAPDVLLATSGDYPDAVAAAALAADRDAPVLLNPPDTLASPVLGALQELGTQRVTLLGGPSALSANVEQQLAAEGLEVDRIAGDTRFDTAAAIAASATNPAVPVAALALGARADGRDAWPDALSAASLAGLDVPVPTLLTTPGDLPDATRDALRQLAPEIVVVLGGTAAVSETVEAQVRDLGIEPVRAEGDNRYRTSVSVAQQAIGGVHADLGSLGASEAVFVSGQDFPDALAAGALAAQRDAPLMLVPGERLDDGVDAFLRDGTTPLQTGVVVGGPNAVSAFVADELTAALTDAPRPQPEPVCPPNSSPDCAYTYRIDIATWDRLATCESGGNWAIATGNGYYGGLQFSLSSWHAVGGAGYPHQASKWEQIHRGELLQARQGWGAWPSCTRALGLR